MDALDESPESGGKFKKESNINMKKKKVEGRKEMKSKVDVCLVCPTSKMRHNKRLYTGVYVYWQVTLYEVICQECNCM